MSMSDPSPAVFNPSALAAMEAIQAVESLVAYAARMQASDLFFLSDERAMSICMRRMGVVEQVAFVSREQGRQLINHAKTMAGLDLHNKRRSGDGRWLMNFGGNRLDLRVSCITTLFGEDLTLRIWDRDIGLRNIDQLGMSAAELLALKTLLSRPSGLLLVTGPTGTGKTTTLYACLQHLSNGRRKINTLEDPIEFALDGVRQSQVQPRAGTDYPDLLRSVLRQAPDVIMIGEVRDEDTATAAVRAANSGHLVLATLHSPVAAAAVQSMLALGTPPYFLASSLLGVIAQRLIRTLCLECRIEYDISDAPQTFAEIQDLLPPGAGQSIFGPGGCNACQHLGYAGRTGLFEIMTMNQELRKLLADARPSHEIAAAAIRNGMIEFRRGALLKVARGITSTEEILRDVPAEYLGLES
jgi:type II secretory ATPase GspE/PulE/Tfp pilus assembly ATPase PilB-like protein